MFKFLVKLFITVMVILLFYGILSNMDRRAPIAKGDKRVKVSSKTEEVEVPISKRVEKTKETKPSIIKQISKKLTRPKNMHISLSEAIEQIGGEIGDPIFIRIFKEESELELWMKHGEIYHLIQIYPICAYSGHLGPKLKEGDRQSPEGFYYVTKNRLNPNSRFHLSFNLGYPNRYDRAYGRTGSFLMVHGECVSIGCYAMTNSKIEEIYELVEQALAQGQGIVRVHAFPFRMTEKNMRRYRGNRWYGFWENLQEGYRWFEEKKVPPNVEVKRKKYIFD